MLKTIGLDGKVYKMDISPSNFPMRTEGSCKSKFQFACGKVLKEKFPCHAILEEVSVPGHRFFLDFFIPAYKLVIEAHGAQHDKYTPYFHKSLSGFKAAQQRDGDKKEWVISNGFEFMEVRTEEELRERLGL